MNKVPVVIESALSTPTAIAGRRLSRVRTSILGKCFTYLLNAYIDARIATSIIGYVRKGHMPDARPEVTERAEKFISLIGQRPRRNEYLMAVAFTLERANGLADYLFAESLARRFLPDGRRGLRQFTHEFGDGILLEPDSYVDDHPSIPAIIRIGSDIYSGALPDLQRYSDAHELPVALPVREIVKMVVLVQAENIRSNVDAARKLRDGADGTAKVEAIRRAAAATPHPHLFIRAAARTQREASNWDALFAHILALRYRTNTRAY